MLACPPRAEGSSGKRSHLCRYYSEHLLLILCAYIACINTPQRCRVRMFYDGTSENDCCNNRDCVNANGPGDGGKDFRCQLTGMAKLTINEHLLRGFLGPGNRCGPKDGGIRSVARSCRSCIR